jgi:Fe-S cluster assembly protein SufD
MNSERQYIELYQQARQVIFDHAPEAMNAMRDQAFEDFKAQGFTSKKVERYKYTDIQKLFEPDYGVNLNRLQIPVDPYNAFRCDVPNLSTSLYFVVNDMFFHDEKPKGHLPEGVIIGSMRDYPELVSKYYTKLAKTSEDAITALNTMLAQDGMLVYVPKNVKVDRAIQVINILKATPQNAQRQVPDLMVNRRVLIIL